MWAGCPIKDEPTLCLRLANVVDVGQPLTQRWLEVSIWCPATGRDITFSGGTGHSGVSTPRAVNIQAAREENTKPERRVATKGSNWGL